MEYDTWERLKKFGPKEGTTIGETSVIPPEDNDQKLYFYDS
jgi:macrodomain Ter protein organizer (MatP/YcbG family)